MTHLLRLFVLAAAVALMAPVAQAALILDLTILNPNQTVGPNDVVTFMGRLTDAASNENAALGSLAFAPYTFGKQEIGIHDPVSQGSVPEPATLALLGVGLAGIGFSRRRTR